MTVPQPAMVRSVHTLSALALLAMLSACSGSRSYAKKAGKLDAAGMYAEAAEMYLQAVQRNHKNVDAKIGLKQAGQRLLDDKLSVFFKNVTMGQDRAAAVQSYLEARNYQERVVRLGVMLDIPEHYKAEFERVKGEHLLDLYDRGQQLLGQQDFAAAERVFSEIARLEPGYKDASSLQAVAYLEPLYRAGVASLQIGAYRKAHEEFGKVVAKDRTYKDAFSLQQEALEKGRFIVAVLPFTAPAGQDAQATKAQAHAMTALTNTGDPFLRVVDRENMDHLLDEQRLGLSGMVDEQTAVRVGNLLGARAVLMGSVIDYREVPGRMRTSTKQAFESYNVQRTDPETGEKITEVKYRPAQYVEYYQENVAVVSISYRLVDLETGEILLSKVEEREAKDNLYYATSKVTPEKLFPIRNGVVDLRSGARNDLRALFNGPREVKSTAVLANDAVRTATATMAAAVQQVLAQRIP
jgi:tetratricopeptide (TPR) repeat protein